MIRQGWAVAEARYPCDRTDQYVKLWRQAQAAKAGLWQVDKVGRVLGLSFLPDMKCTGGRDHANVQLQAGRPDNQSSLGRELET